MFKISKDQVDSLLQVFGEIPSKFSFNAIILLKSLEPLDEKSRDKKNDDSKSG